MGGRHSITEAFVKRADTTVWVRFCLDPPSLDDFSYRKSRVYLISNENNVSAAARMRHKLQQDPAFETSSTGEFCDVPVRQASSIPIGAENVVANVLNEMNLDGYAVLKGSFRSFQASKNEAQSFVKQLADARSTLGWKLCSLDDRPGGDSTFDFIQFQGDGVSSLHTDGKFWFEHPLVAFADEDPPISVRQVERFWVSRATSGKRLLLLNFKNTMADTDWADEMKDVEAVKHAVLLNFQHFRVSPQGAMVLFSSLGLRMVMHAGVPHVCSGWLRRRRRILRCPCRRHLRDAVDSVAIQCVWEITEPEWVHNSLDFIPHRL